jgi:hypothetical protein
MGGKESVKSLIENRDVAASGLFMQLLEVQAGGRSVVNIVTRKGETVALNAVPIIQVGEKLVEAPVSAPALPTSLVQSEVDKIGAGGGMPPVPGKTTRKSNK